MKKQLAFALAFASGAAISFATTWAWAERKAMKRYLERVQTMEHVQEKVSQLKAKRLEEEAMEALVDYQIESKVGSDGETNLYHNIAVDPRVVLEQPNIILISDDQFMEDDAFQKVLIEANHNGEAYWSFHIDGKLVMEWPDMIGHDALDYLQRNNWQPIYIRNHSYMTDYELVKLKP